jgi:hypothetical protein
MAMPARYHESLLLFRGRFDAAEYLCTGFDCYQIHPIALIFVLTIRTFGEDKMGHRGISIPVPNLNLDLV